MNLSCLFCDYPIHVNQRMKPGQQLSCPKCKTVFRLITTSPFTIDWLEIREGKQILPEDGEFYFDELE